jgi:hypothetical protein
MTNKSDITQKADLTIFMKGRKSWQIKETKEKAEKARLLKQQKTFFCSAKKMQKKYFCCIYKFITHSYITKILPKKTFPLLLKNLQKCRKNCKD